jgi:SAM-dependent methyltransferase
MCNAACILFVAQHVSPELVKGKKVVELGIGRVGVKPLLMGWVPQEYVGVNIHPSPEVDVVLSAEVAAEKLGRDRFDLVLSTETLEHVRDWRRVVQNLKSLCKPGGRIIVTTRSRGFRYHSPPDFWRYELSDVERIFSDCEDVVVQSDPLEPGVFVSARRRSSASDAFADLSGVALWSVNEGRRTLEIPASSPSTAMTAFRLGKAWTTHLGKQFVWVLRYGSVR